MGHFICLRFARGLQWGLITAIHSARSAEKIYQSIVIEVLTFNKKYRHRYDDWNKKTL